MNPASFIWTFFVGCETKTPSEHYRWAFSLPYSLGAGLPGIKKGLESVLALAKPRV